VLSTAKSIDTDDCDVLNVVFDPLVEICKYVYGVEPIALIADVIAVTNEEIV